MPSGRDTIVVAPVGFQNHECLLDGVFRWHSRGRWTVGICTFPIRGRACGRFTRARVYWRRFGAARMDSTMGRRLSVGSISPIFCTLTSDERICGCEFQALVVITLVTRVRVVLVTTSDHVHVCADPRDTGLPRTSQAMQSASLQISPPPSRGFRTISAEKMSPTAQSHGKRRWRRRRNQIVPDRALWTRMPS